MSNLLKNKILTFYGDSGAGIAYTIGTGLFGSYYNNLLVVLPKQFPEHFLDNRPESSNIQVIKDILTSGISDRTLLSDASIKIHKGIFVMNGGAGLSDIIPGYQDNWGIIIPFKSQKIDGRWRIINFLKKLSNHVEYNHIAVRTLDFDGDTITTFEVNPNPKDKMALDIEIHESAVYLCKFYLQS